jgi:protein-disulfide isomerase
MNKQTRFSMGALLLIFLAIVVVIVAEQSGDGSYNNDEVLERDYSPSMGNNDAKVTIVEFFDPACETCKSFHPFVKRLMQKNPGKIRLVLRYTPLHKGSDDVARFLEATRLQGKFWQSLDAIYEAQPIWASHHNPQPEKLWELLDYVGLDLNKVRHDMQSATIAQRLQQDIDDARALQVTKTPGFFVNGKPLVQFGSRQLQQLVESEIRNNY